MPSAALHTATADLAPTGNGAVRVFDGLATAEPVWRRLEQTAMVTPAQRFDWLAPLLAARPPDGRVAIAVVERHKRPAALFALEIGRRAGIAVATPLGADAGNGFWPVVEPDVARTLDAAATAALLAEIGAAAGIDLFLFDSQRHEIGGIANPLLTLPHQPAPDRFYAAPLGRDRLNAKRIRNIQRGRRRLEEAMGPVRLVAAATPSDVARIHEAFLAQRGARFASQGIPNVFAEPGFVRFFRDAAMAGLGDPRPPLRFHALFAGDEIVATSVGSHAGTHFAQYINSTVDGPAAKYSLMGIMLFDLVEALAAEGIETLDMGLGDFDYKTDWTDPEEVYDSAIPVSARGRLAAPALLALRRMKRAIKRNPAMFGAFKRARAVLLRAGGGR